MVDEQPPHPWEVLRDQFLTPLGISIAHAARGLGVSRTALSKVVNGKGGISPLMALRLSLAFGIRAEYWMELQARYDLWRAKDSRVLKKVKRIKEAQLTLF